jgi:hypothetical protein
MKTAVSLVLALFALCMPLLVRADENKAPQLNYCWANGVIYGLLLPSELKVSSGMRNTLYIFRNLKGQRPVAESGPGDLDYQNGRFEIALMDFTPKGISALDPDKDGNCEFEITTGKMVKDYIDQGYVILAGRGVMVDYKVVPPELYQQPKMEANKSGSISSK